MEKNIKAHNKIEYVKLVEVVEVKIIKESNGAGSPLREVIQYWHKNGRLIAEIDAHHLGKVKTEASR